MNTHTPESSSPLNRWQRRPNGSIHSACIARFIGVGSLPSQVVQEIKFPGLKREAGTHPLHGRKSGAAHATVSEPEAATSHCAHSTGRCGLEDFMSIRKPGDRPETRTRRLALGDVRPVTISAYRSPLSSPDACTETVSMHVVCTGVDR